MQALAEDGHDVYRVADASGVDTGAPDETLLDAAVATDRVLLTADQSDFADPPRDDHPGIVVVTDVTVSGCAVRRAIRRLDRTVPDLTGTVAYLGDWT